MLHLDVLDGVGDHALAADVGGGQDVGDVAVDEDVAGVEAEEGGFGDAGVGAAEPEDLGLLALGEGGEEVGLVLGGCLGPFFVVLERELEGICEVERVSVSCVVSGTEEEHVEGVTFVR